MSVILFGYYGYQNIGDDQLLNETIYLVDNAPKKTRFIVANGPEPTQHPSFNRWNLRAWIKELRSAHTLLFGGGSVFQSKSSRRSLLYYLFIVQLAYICSCRVLLLCHGWGPFKYKWHERLTKWGLRHAHRCWRHPAPFKNDTVFCDLTLLQPIRNQATKGNLIGVALKSSPTEQQLHSYLTSNQHNVILIYNLLHKIWDHHHLNLNFVITDRFHVAIWASQHGIPWAIVSTDPKCIYIANDANQPCYSSVEELINANDWSTYANGRHLRFWVQQHRSFAPLIKHWLYEKITC
jgi:polysaccharide pyruvyl transferase WcaK-like protein